MGAVVVTSVDRTTPSQESNAHRHVPPAVDVIAQAIRVADGNHRMSAGALGAVAVKALREAGYTLMHPVCEGCDDGFAS